MTVLDFVLLVGAGICAGLVGSVAGLASLISYPALLAAGVPPLTANMTNTVAMVFQGVGSVSASRPELRGQGRRVLRLTVASALGGAAGAALLMLTPTSVFERVVPVLIGGASAGAPRPATASGAGASRVPVSIPAAPTTTRGGCRSAPSPSPSTAATSAPPPAS